MKLPSAPWQSGKGMRPLLAALDAKSGATRYVGGCVRDTLLGLPVSDVDLATRLPPEQVMERLEQAGIKAIPTGLAHGTVTAVIGGRPVEVTTLRRDVSTDGRRATIAYTDDWAEDAGRRDFTINAFSANPANGEIFDYFDGLADLETRRVRFIGDPLVRIAEDHLRILRFFRFHARFGGGEADSEALDACAERANDLMALSRERIADELLKLLALAEPVEAVRLMVERDILKPVLPEIHAAGVERLDRLIGRERTAGVAGDPIRRLAALLPADPAAAASIAARLRLSKRAAKRLAAAATRQSGTAGPALLAYRLGRDEAVDSILLGESDPGLVRSLDDWSRPRLMVGGGDLIRLGIEPGPLVARTLQAIEREWSEAGFSADKAEQRAIARRHVDQALSRSARR
jgi:poly(A) polymerase